MSTLKKLVVRSVGMLGCELIKKPVASTHKHELSGISFSQFLNLYIAARDLSNFFFIQIGAFDGVTNDAVHALAVGAGLKGLVIEPQAAMFATLTANYKGCDNLIFENAAIAHENGEKPLY